MAILKTNPASSQKDKQKNVKYMHTQNDCQIYIEETIIFKILYSLKLKKRTVNVLVKEKKIESSENFLPLSIKSPKMCRLELYLIRKENHLVWLIYFAKEESSSVG